MSKKVLIVRNFASEVKTEAYNLQEIGMGKALVRKGYNCDVIYYTSQDSNEEVIFETEGRKLTIKWTKAVKFMSNSIYYSLLKKSFLNNYDFIISTEYNQIMTFLLSLICNNKLYLYHGPYVDNSNKIVQWVYDAFLTPIITRKITKVYAKSDLAKDYLKSKGFISVKTIGVGLDIEKLESNNIQSPFVNNNANLDFNKSNILYVGILEERRNIKFLFEILANLVKRKPDVNLILVGDGKQEDVKGYFSLAANLNINNHITHIKSVEQSELKYLYKNADLFLFPTSYDIFGMVLLESMYYKLPVVSSHNGGSQTLISNDNGIVINDFNEDMWANTVYKVLNDKSLQASLGRNAYKQVIKGFTWDKIIDKILT